MGYTGVLYIYIHTYINVHIHWGYIGIREKMGTILLQGARS